MYRIILFAALVMSAFNVNAQTLPIDDFETYIDDFDVQENWVFSKAGGPDGLYAWLETNGAIEGSNCLAMDIDMPEKWWHNIIRKEIPIGPLDLSEYLNIQFQFAGDASVTPGALAFNVFLYDSAGRVLKFALPNDYIVNPEWQKITLSLDAFSEEEWDSGYGTDAPDADKTDIVSVGLMTVGNEVEQFATFYVDDIKMNIKPESMVVDAFDGYANNDDLNTVWQFSKAGGPDGLFISIDDQNPSPQGSGCLLMDVDLPEKWWHNTVRKDFEAGALSLSKFAAVEMWFYGDANVTPGQLTFTVFLYDSQGRALRFALPNDYTTNASWQKLTLSLDAFGEEEWDAGYGTDTPDANQNDVVALGLMCVGDDVDQVATFYVDDVQFVSQQAAASITGTITEADQPLAGVMVFAIDQNSVYQTVTDESGAYSFNDLQQGKQYRVGPIAKYYDFDPAAETVTMFGDAYTQDFSAIPSLFNSLEDNAIADQFDPSGLNPEIVYRGSREWGHEEAGDVRPIIDVTQDTFYQVNFPDAAGDETVLYYIEPNTLEGATSPSYALEVGGFFSWDMLAFGQNADANYFVEVDAYCDVRFDAPENMFDRISLAVHCSVFNPDKPSMDALGDSNTYRSSGGYAISFETDSGDIIARKYAPGNSKVHVINRTEGFAEDFARVTLTDSGWHRFRIEYLNGKVSFLVDGAPIAEINDGDYPFGPAGLHYRACYSDALSDMLYMNHARFDNLKAGPTAPTAVLDWMLN